MRRWKKIKRALLKSAAQDVNTRERACYGYCEAADDTLFL